MSGRVIWITGLSSAGKTTIAQALNAHFNKAILLDGDALRHVLNTSTSGFDAHSRQELAFTYARFAHLLALQGHTVLVATISLFHAVHAWNRTHLPRYTEVFLDVSEQIRRERDPKGLYAAEKNTDASPMAGLQTAVELPLHPHVHIQGEHPIKDVVNTILQALPV